MIKIPRTSRSQTQGTQLFDTSTLLLLVNRRQESEKTCVCASERTLVLEHTLDSSPTFACCLDVKKLLPKCKETRTGCAKHTRLPARFPLLILGVHNTPLPSLSLSLASALAPPFSLPSFFIPSLHVILVFFEIFVEFVDVRVNLS